MTREETRARIEEIGIIPAIRVSSAEDALFAAEAVSESAIPIVEVTMTVPGAVEVIRQLTSHHPDVMVGAGTLFRIETARRCLDAGAAFLTTPGLDLEIVNFAHGEFYMFGAFVGYFMLCFGFGGMANGPDLGFAPLLAALRSGRVRQLHIESTTAYATLRWESTRRDQWMFWKRPRSLAATAQKLARHNA